MRKNMRSIEDAREISTREQQPLLPTGLEFEPPSSQALIDGDQGYSGQMGQGMQGQGSDRSSSPAFPIGHLKGSEDD